MQPKIIYLTPEGVERFMAELSELVSVRRAEITERLRLARDFTQSDDPDEFEQARMDQAFVEGRILELEVLLANSQSIAEGPMTDHVRLGSTVTVVELDTNEEPCTYRIVGSAEADSRRGLVSDQSPTGKPLLGHHVDDQVTVEAPGGAFRVRITAIS